MLTVALSYLWGYLVDFYVCLRGGVWDSLTVTKMKHILHGILVIWYQIKVEDSV